MIDRIAAISDRLLFLRPFFVLLGVCAGGIAAFEIFGAGIGETDHLPIALLGLLWSILGFSGLGLFAQVPPSGPAPGFFANLRLRALRGMYYILALAFVVVSLVGAYMTYKLISLS